MSGYLGVFLRSWIQNFMPDLAQILAIKELQEYFCSFSFGGSDGINKLVLESSCWGTSVWALVFVCGVNAWFLFVFFTDVQANGNNAPVSAEGNQSHNLIAKKIFLIIPSYEYICRVDLRVCIPLFFLPPPFSSLIFLFVFFSWKFRCECMQKAKAKNICVRQKKQQNNALLSLATYHISKRKKMP